MVCQTTADQAMLSDGPLKMKPIWVPTRSLSKLLTRFVNMAPTQDPSLLLSIVSAGSKQLLSTPEIQSSNPLLSLKTFGSPRVILLGVTR